MTPADLEQLAGSLSEAQRAALLRAEPDGWIGNYFVRWWMANGRTLRAMRKNDLGTAVWSGIVLSPKALALRDHLIRTRSSSGEA